MTKKLPVMELFHSLQGEGAHTGRSAFFIRLASCTVGCTWCDTKNSWSAEMHPEQSIFQLSKLVAEAQKEGAAFVVLTGGEPLHHNLDNLCKEIRRITSINKSRPIPIHLETSGVDPISGDPSWITLSPKRHSPPRHEILKNCNELKVIIHEKKDIIFAEEMVNQTKANASLNNCLFLQAGWDNQHGLQLALEHVKRNPKWRLSMQTHKWLEVL